MLNTPVLLIIFNRPDTTIKVFNEIRKIKPKELFVAADGPRFDVQTDIVNCKKTRQLIDNNIDWDCNVHKLYHDNNLGCGIAPSTAITWFFSHVEQGIIIEDDCLPNESFFDFCEELLNKYKNNHKIMHISGDNYLFGKKKIKKSYYFSKYPHIWGWATWRRAWQYFDFDMKKYNEFWLSNEPLKIHSVIEYQYWTEKFEGFIDKNDNSIWDYQWTFAIWSKQGISVLPSQNLVTNIGFGVDATHTMQLENSIGQSSFQIKFPLIHQQKVRIDRQADTINFYNTFAPHLKTNIMNILRFKISKIIPRKIKSLLIKLMRNESN